VTVHGLSLTILLIYITHTQQKTPCPIAIFPDVRAPHPVTHPIAFTASLSHELNPVHAHQVVHFDTVVTNIGDGYAPGGGLFTATIPGVYQFTVTVISEKFHFSEVVIVKNGAGAELCRAHADGDAWDSGTCLATVHLAADDHVWVQQLGGNVIFGQNYSSFSGHLILADG
jgi:hypothetical protein